MGPDRGDDSGCDETSSFPMKRAPRVPMAVYFKLKLAREIVPHHEFSLGTNVCTHAALADQAGPGSYTKNSGESEFSIISSGGSVLTISSHGSGMTVEKRI